ncbi:MAG TPA: tetratricopeptide repeat protein [Candidatus Polarisedimenticolia bacterium]|nr:tetratricopeptide repeat protein [Candidatus Polarisedimenticolia bacterium]
MPRLRPLIILSGILFLAAAPSPPDYRTVMQSAREAFAAGNFTATMALLDRAMTLDPGAPAAFVLLGQASIRLERFADASAALARAAELSGGEATVEGRGIMNMLAFSLARQDRNIEALDVLDRLLTLDGARPAAWLLRGNVHLALGQPSLARGDFARALELGPAPPPDAGIPAPAGSMTAAAYQGLGISAYRLGDDAAALAALRLAPHDVDARYHLALTQARIGSHAEAITSFQQVTAQDATHRGALQGLARSAGALAREPERSRALSTLHALYRLDEERRSTRVKVSLLRTHALAKAAAGDARGATADLEKAVQLAPGDLEARLDLGRALSMAGDRRRGEQVLRELIARDAMNAEAHYHLGRLLLEGNDAAAAAAPLEAACRLAPTNAAFRVALGEAGLLAGNVDEGIRHLRLARDLAPSDPECVYSLGIGLARADALHEAAAELERAAALDGQDPRPHAALADVYRRLGDAEKSRREQEIFRRLNARVSRPT